MEAKGNDNPRYMVGFFHPRLHIRPHGVYESYEHGAGSLKRNDLTAGQGSKSKHGPVGSVFST